MSEKTHQSSITSEMMYQWDSGKYGITMNVPLQWGIESRGEVLGCTECIAYNDKWGVLIGPREDPSAEIRDVVPRTVSVLLVDEFGDLPDVCRKLLRKVLEVPNVLEINGETDMWNITVGDKLNTGLILAGKPAFAFSYSVGGDTWNGHYVIGVPDSTRNLTVVLHTTCPSQDTYDTLPDYAKTVLNHFSNPVNLHLYPPAQKEEPTPDESYFTAPAGVDAKWDYGVLSYRNTHYAIAFKVPAYPMTLKPRTSLILANTRVDLFNLTMVLRVSPPEMAVDDKECDVQQQPVEVSLGIDVEDIIRARHPTILSAAEYGTIKMRSVMSEFVNTKPSGTPLTNFIGNRSGVSYLWTGSVSSDLHSKFCKAMCCVTLNNNMGVVVSYFTRTGQGLFDMNLHIMQGLLKGVYFIPEREADGAFQRSEATAIRLITEDDFTEAFEDKKQQVQRYAFLASCSTGGVVKGFHGVPIVPFPNEMKEDEETSRRKKKTRYFERGISVATEELPVDVSDIPHLQKTSFLMSADDESAASASINESVHIDNNSSPRKSEAVSCNSSPMGVASPLCLSEKEEIQEDFEVEESSEIEEEPGIKVMYREACAKKGVKPNSQFLSRLPSEPAHAANIEELDMSLNYFGRGFDCVVYLFQFLPKLHTLRFNDMSLGNDEVRVLCKACESLPGLRQLTLRRNPNISLASSKPLLHFIKSCPTLTVLELNGTSLGPEVMNLLAAEVASNSKQSED